MGNKSMNELSILAALHFAAERHKHQRRKGESKAPYVNHVIEVAHTLKTIGEIKDQHILIAALLHDILEDTETQAVEIESLFGPEVLKYVEEVTDDKSLPKAVRKQGQIDKAAHLSQGAKLIKLADKAANVADIANDPPPNWPKERQIAYLAWAEKVVQQMEGTHKQLEEYFHQCLQKARMIVY